MTDNDNNTPPLAGPWSAFQNPIVIVVLMIVLSVICLIGAAVVGIDVGVLRAMSRAEYARGLVTYLFAIVTIGTAVVMVLSGLLGADDEATEKRFQRGKEILSLLLGVFGTIVGFYFGAEAASPSHAANQGLKISTVHVEAVPGDTTGRTQIRAVVTGGTPPYTYSIKIGSTDGEKKLIGEDGWVVDTVAASPPGEGGKPAARVLIVEDDAGEHEEKRIGRSEPSE